MKHVFTMANGRAYFTKQESAERVGNAAIRSGAATTYSIVNLKPTGFQGYLLRWTNDNAVTVFNSGPAILW